MNVKLQFYYNEREIENNKRLKKPTSELTVKGFLTKDLTAKLLVEGPVFSGDHYFDFQELELPKETREIWILQPNRDVNILNFNLDFLDRDRYSDPHNFYDNHREFFKEFEMKYSNGSVGRRVTFDIEKIRGKNYDAIRVDWNALEWYFQKLQKLDFYTEGIVGGVNLFIGKSILWVNWCFGDPIHNWFNLPHSEDENQEVDFNKIKEIDLTKYEDNELDRVNEVITRVEQSDLRRHLFGGKKTGCCGICGKEFPTNLLIAAHIKKRSECKPLEKKDKNIVMPMCAFGCDYLYERGYISVINGKIFSNHDQFLTDDVRNYIKEIEGKECKYYNELTKDYFLWQNTHHHN